MTGIQFNGRLGNQLFQYYFLLYLKNQDPSRLYFFDNTDQAYFYKYFEVGWFTRFSLSSRIYRIFTSLLKKVFNFKTVYIHNFSAPKKISPKPFTLYHGYFQSEWYLKNNTHYHKLNIKKKYTDQFKQQFGLLFKEKKTIAVHIRLTDYQNYGKRDISLPLKYFMEQLNRFENTNTCQIIFISDEIKKVKDYFGEKPNYLFSDNNEIMDFQIIMNADIAIISNSTFAWWARYFGSDNGLTIAPKNWIGFKIGREHPKGIMTGKFNWAQVN